MVANAELCSGQRWGKNEEDSKQPTLQYFKPRSMEEGWQKHDPSSNLLQELTHETKSELEALLLLHLKDWQVCQMLHR